MASVPKKYEHIDFTPPESVANAAAKGLELRQKASPSNRGGLTPAEASKEGIGSGVQRAVNLKNRDNVSPEVIKQMRGFLSRSQKSSEISAENKDTPWNDKGYVAWLLWGGDPAVKWVDKVIKQMEAADEKEAEESKKSSLMEKWGSFLVEAEDNEPTDPGLWERSKDKARERYTKWPSAYAVGHALKIYKDEGGGWRRKADVTAPPNPDGGISTLPRNRWVLVSWEELSDRVQGSVWDVYNLTYGQIGTHVPDISTFARKYKLLYLIDVDEDVQADAFIAYKPTHAGYKIMLGGSDGSRVAKQALIRKMHELIRQPGWYAEASHKVADILEAAGMRPINDEQIVREVLGGKDLEWLGDGKYRRSLEESGTPAVKSMYGTPRVRRGATKSATRPIRIDRAEVQRVSGLALAEFERVLKDVPDGASFAQVYRRPYYEGPRPFTRFEVVDVRGQPVQVNMYVGLQGLPRKALVAGVTEGKRDMYVMANALMPKAELLQALRKEVFSVVAHEVTHLIDVLPDMEGTDTVVRTEDAAREYFNRLPEVRGWMRQIYEEIRDEVHRAQAAGKNLGRAITDALTRSPSWGDASPFLSPKNRKTMLKGLVTAFEDDAEKGHETRTAGWWEPESGGLIGDGPADVMDEAVGKVRELYRSHPEISREPTMGELWETLGFVTGPAINSGEIQKEASTGKHQLPELPYAYDALEPHISEETLRFHHDKHHKAYVDGLNKAELDIEKARENGGFESIPALNAALSFNSSGNTLHTMYWESLTPDYKKPSETLVAAIEKDFGSWEAFRSQMKESMVKVRGSGWGVLVLTPAGMRILSVMNHEDGVMWDSRILLPIDAWEHAYYIDYQNDRVAHFEAVFDNLINWSVVENRMERAPSSMKVAERYRTVILGPKTITDPLPEYYKNVFMSTAGTRTAMESLDSALRNPDFPKKFKREGQTILSMIKDIHEVLESESDSLRKSTASESYDKDLNWAVHGLNSAADEIEESIRKGGPQRNRSILGSIRTVGEKLKEFVGRVRKYSESYHPIDWFSDQFGLSFTRTAATVTVDRSHVDQLRKDVLMIARAADNVKSREDINQVTGAIRAWRSRWETFEFTLRQDLEQRLWQADRPYDSERNPNPPDKSDAEYYLKNALAPMWEFDTELGRSPRTDTTLKDTGGNPWKPPEEVFEETVQFFLDRGYSATREEAVREAQKYHDRRPLLTKEEAEAASVARWKAEAVKWTRRLRDKARKAWDTLGQYVDWLGSWRGGARPLEVIHPEEELVSIAGFRVVFRGFEESSYKDELASVRAGLERYRKAIAARAPILLKLTPPIFVEWTSEPSTSADAAAYYTHNQVNLTPWVIGKDIDRFVKTMAHEVGHHLFRVYLSSDAKAAWSRFILGNYKDLDLREALAVMERVGARSVIDKELMEEDPILHLQLSTLMHDPTYKNKSLMFASHIRRYLDDGGDPVVRVPVHPITGYAAKNSDEAFCEALGNLVAYGPKAVPDVVLGMLRSVMGGEVRIASRVASAWTSRTAAETGDGSEHVGVFAPLPPDIAAQFPRKEEDTSRPHVTLCYVGPVPDVSDQWELIRSVMEFYSKEIGPVMARLSGVEYFRHANGCVAYSKVVFSKDMGSMKDRLKSMLMDRGVEVSDSHPLAFSPHVTLAYYDDPHAVWEGPIPTGSWEFGEVEIWGLPKVHKVPIGAGLVYKWGSTLKESRGEAWKDVGYGGLDEWFSGHGGDEGEATWGDWVSISPVTKTLPSGREVEKGEIVGECGISDDPDWKEITKGGKDPLKCMPRQKAYDMPKAERAEIAEAKQEAEKSDSDQGKDPTVTPTFGGNKKARLERIQAKRERTAQLLLKTGETRG